MEEIQKLEEKIQDVLKTLTERREEYEQELEALQRKSGNSKDIKEIKSDLESIQKEFDEKQSDLERIEEYKGLLVDF